LKRKHSLFSEKTLFIIFVSMFLLQCFHDDDEPYWLKTVPYVFSGEYNLIKVPVPEGGIDFPIGLDDDDTARVEKAFYIGETLVTRALWDTVARWAINREYGQYYLIDNHHERDNGVNHKDNKVGIYPDLPVGMDTEQVSGNSSLGSAFNSYGQLTVTLSGFYVIPQWCNAFTEWYNEKYGTNLVPVYQDALGNTIRFISNITNFLATANPDATGFRLPSIEEWELAARWNGGSDINVVTKTINGIDFSSQPIKFTTGRSASGARSQVDNFEENDRVAVWKNNQGYGKDWLERIYSTMFLSPVKTKDPNMLGIYDMSGNAREATNTWENRYTGQYTYTDFAKCKGGSASSDYLGIAIGGKPSETGISGAHGSFSGGSTGFRVVRNVE